MNKQQLQQEIEALQKQLEEKQKALAAMPEKWEPKGGEWFIDMFGEASTTSILAREASVFGLAYATLQQAEKAAKAMRAHNRLLAYVAEFAPDWEPSWDDGEFCIEYCHKSSEFDFEVHFTEKLGAVYMPRRVAFELVEKLSRGEVEL